MKYRKKPVVIDAFCWPLPSGLQDRGLEPEWFDNAWKNRKITVFGTHLEIETLEGLMKANIGDYIIQGIKGEIYPCKPDIFEATYEPVTEER